MGRAPNHAPSPPPSPPRWLRASRTVAPSLAVLGCLLVAAEAVQRLEDLDRWANRMIGHTELFGLARRDAWLRLGTALCGGLLGLLLAFASSGRLVWSLGLGALGLVVVVSWRDAVNALPFLAAAVLAWTGDDPRLHPGPVAAPEGWEGGP